MQKGTPYTTGFSALRKVQILHATIAYSASMPHLDDIVLTLAAVDRPSFAIVAHERHVSQSTVSRAVQRVEAALGFEVFERDGRNIRLRPEAEGAVDGLRTMITQWELLRSNPEAYGPTTLSIYCTVTASQSIAPDLLSKFRLAHPEITLDLRTGPASAALDAARTGEVDAAIAPLPERLPRAMVSVDVTTTPLAAFAAIDYAAPGGDWSGVHLIAPGQGVTRTLVDQWRRSLSVPNTIQTTRSHEEVVALTALGSGVGIVPLLVVESSALRPRLVFLEPPARLPIMRLGLCARRSAVQNGPLAKLWAMLAA